jgi:hypothetical protein
MADGYDIKPGSLRAASGQLAAAAEQVSGGLSGIRDTVSGEGNPWGSDEPGTVFGQLYVAAMNTAMDVIGGYAEQLTEAGQALTAIGSAISDGDRQLADAYLDLLNQLR